MPRIVPATSERNFTPSCTALSGPLSTTAGTVLLDQMVTDAEALTVMLRALVTDCAAESVSRTVKLNEPAAVGVPLIVPPRAQGQAGWKATRSQATSYRGGCRHFPPGSPNRPYLILHWAANLS